MSAAVDGVVAVRGTISEVELDALLVHAAEQLVPAVVCHRQLLQGHDLNGKNQDNLRTKKRESKTEWGGVNVRDSPSMV